MIKIITVIGARPQFIKAAAISRALLNHSEITEILVHTGQHFDEKMSDIFFTELDIKKPQYNLGINGGSHGAMTGQMLQDIEKVLLKESPNLLLIYGDTNSTLAGALAAAKIHIPVAHVEAGLRSFNRKMPEEINRVMADHLSEFLFAPTAQAVMNLEREGISKEKIHRVGDVMFDASKYYSQKNQPHEKKILEKFGLEPNKYVLATLHRAENTDDETQLRKLVACLNHASKKLNIIFPIHPRTRIALSKLTPSVQFSSNVKVVEPVGYLEMLTLEKNARLIITDSGGVQKEAYFCQVQCLTMREETEWNELVTSGWNILTGTDIDRFAEAFHQSLHSSPPPFSDNLYGNGNSAEQIISILKQGY